MMEAADVFGLSTGAQYSGMFVNVGMEQLRKALAIFAAERGWADHHTPRNLLISLFKEVGELSELFQWRGEVGPHLAGFSSADKHRLAQELSEVLLYLIRLADVCEVDLGRAVLEKLTHNAAKYPKQQQGQEQQQQQQTQSRNNRCITTGLLVQPPKQQGQDVASCAPKQDQPQQTTGAQDVVPGGSSGSNTGSTHGPSSTAGFICNLPALGRQPQQQAEPRSAASGHNLGEGIIASGGSTAPAVAASSSSAKATTTAVERAPPCQLQTQQQTGDATGAPPTPQNTEAAVVSVPQLPAVPLALSAVRSPLVSPAAVAALIQQQQQGLLVDPVSAVGALVSDLQSTTSFCRETAGLLPQGLLDEIGPQRGNVGSSTTSASGDGVAVSNSGASGSKHVGKTSMNCTMLSPAESNTGSPTAAPSATEAATIEEPQCVSSSSSSSGSSGGDNAAAAASAAACSSATSSLWLTAAMASREASTSSAATAPLLGSFGQSFGSVNSNLTSQCNTSVTSCGTGHQSWQFSASSLEPSASQPPSVAGEESEVESEVAAAAGAPAIVVGGAFTAGPAPACPGRGASFKQYAPPVITTAVASSTAAAGTSLGFGIPGPQQQQQQQQQPIISNISRIGHVPVVSLAAAVAAAAAAATSTSSNITMIDPGQHLAVSVPSSTGVAGLPYAQLLSPQRLLPSQLLPSYEVCSRCGGLHTGKCPTKAKCMRCFRKAHLGDCWTRCVSCNLVHAPGKCRAAAPANRDSSNSKDQQQQQQQQGLPSPGAAVEVSACSGGSDSEATATSSAAAATLAATGAAGAF